AMRRPSTLSASDTSLGSIHLLRPTELDLAEGHEHKRGSGRSAIGAVRLSQPRGHCGEFPGLVFGAFDRALRESREPMLLAEFSRQARMFTERLRHGGMVPSPEERAVVRVVGADDLQLRLRDRSVLEFELDAPRIEIGGPVRFLAEMPRPGMGRS